MVRGIRRWVRCNSRKNLRISSGPYSEASSGARTDARGSYTLLSPHLNSGTRVNIFQKYVHRNIPVYKGINSAAVDIFRHEGIRGLYKGLTVSLVKAAPLSAVTMWSFEESLKLLEWFDEKSVEL